MKKFIIGAIALIMAVTPLMSAVACSGDDGDGAETEQEQVCEHNLFRVNRREPTCLTEGNISHYKCSLCGKTYFDEKAKIELSAENIVISKVQHTIEHYSANESVAEYWRCIGCDNYYTDEALTQQTTYKQLFKDYYNPVKLNDVTVSGDLFNAASEISPLYEDFTFRCFIGWKSDAGDISQFPDEGEVQVNINLNRINAGSPDVDWYNFGVGYSKKIGLFYKPVESGDRIRASSALTDLFVKQGGIYVVVIRRGATISAFFENGDGFVHMTSGSQFGAEHALERLAANNATTLDGWVTSVTETAICIGIADTKCIFDKAYES